MSIIMQKKGHFFITELVYNRFKPILTFSVLLLILLNSLCSLFVSFSVWFIIAASTLISLLPEFYVEVTSFNHIFRLLHDITRSLHHILSLVLEFNLNNAVELVQFNLNWKNWARKRRFFILFFVDIAHTFDWKTEWRAIFYLENTALGNWKTIKRFNCFWNCVLIESE